ncbi:MAG: NucA/NucB deoxyribonuclease domain-containing protein [Brucella intermedia]
MQSETDGSHRAGRRGYARRSIHCRSERRCSGGSCDAHAAPINAGCNKGSETGFEQAGKYIEESESLPISSTIMPNIATHISTAQSTGQPGYLTRVASPLARINRRLATGKLPSAGFGKSWDEYPFASSLQGGFGASVAAVPARENLIQGGVVALCYRLETINPGDNFFVVVIP